MDKQKRRINRTKRGFSSFSLCLLDFVRIIQRRTNSNKRKRRKQCRIVCACLLYSKSNHASLKTEQCSLGGALFAIQQNTVVRRMYPDFWICLQYNHFKRHQETKSAYLFAFVCCALNRCNAALFAMRGFNRRLFAVLKTGVLAQNQLYLSRPFSPYAIKGKCAHLTRSTKLGTIAGAWI